MKQFSLVCLSFLLLATCVFGEDLNYQLLPDSIITPISGGDSQQLTGSFTWVPHIPSYVVDSDTFDIVSLVFNSLSYQLTLEGEQPDNITQIGPEGQTALNANVNWLGSSQNPWALLAYENGSYMGSANAPTQIISYDALYPYGGGYSVAFVYIDAQLATVPESGTFEWASFGAVGILLTHRRLCKA